MYIDICVDTSVDVYICMCICMYVLVINESSGIYVHYTDLLIAWIFYSFFCIFLQVQKKTVFLIPQELTSHVTT